MFDINRHRYYLVQLLKEIYSDPELANTLGFKGGTALMFFYELPRFSVDLEFDLINPLAQDLVYEKIRSIILRHGSIFDEAKKHYGLLLVLDYGYGERKLKIEISNRRFESTYEIKNLLGFNVRVMTLTDMFSHKLCALTDRISITNRDIFDIWFFLKKQTPINKNMVEQRMKLPLEDYLSQCIKTLESLKTGKSLLDGLGELLDPSIKGFVKSDMLSATITDLRFYQNYPILSPLP
jgi:predicted nucleotidyltransferase component of viral defense system